MIDESSWDSTYIISFQFFEFYELNYSAHLAD